MINGKMFTAFLCGLIITAETAFAQQLIKTDTAHYLKVRIDPSNANGGNVGDVFDQVKYIPLETTAESLFGSIKQLEVTDECFVILDNSTNCILIFNRDGKFRAKIKGSADQLRLPLRNMSINRFTRQIVFSGDRGKSYTYCNFDGKEEKTVKYAASTKNEIDLNKHFFIARDKIINYSGYEPADSLRENFKPFSRSLLQFAKTDRTVYAKGLIYHPSQGKTIDMGSGQFTYQGKDTTFMLGKMRPYSIYQITPNSITLRYRFVFPALSSLPENQSFDTNDPSSIMGYFEKHNQEILALNNCYQIGSNLLFQAETWGRSKEDDLIYNLKSGNLIAVKHLSPDELSSFLPVYDAKGTTSGTKGISSSDGKYVYVSISSLGMFTARDDYKDKNPKYDAALTNYFKNGTVKDNPVIVQLKLKGEL